MRLSDAKEEKKTSGIVYGVLALYTPLSILTAIVFLIGAVLPIPFPILRVLISGCAAGVIASLYYELIRDRRINQSASHIRGGVAIVIIAYFAVSLFGFPAPSLAKRFFPTIANSVASLAVIYVWVMVIILKEIFHGRKRFERYAETYVGEALQRLIIEDAVVINTLSIDKAKRLYGIQIVIVGVFTAVVLGIKGNFPLPLAFFLLFILVSSVCVFGFFSLMKREYYFAGEGMAVSAEVRVKKLLAMPFFALGAIIFGVLFAARESILPLSLIGDFFRWLASLFKRPPPPLPRVFNAPEETFEPLPPLTRPFEGMEKNIAPWEGWKYVRYAFIALIAFFFLWFMVKPFFEKRITHSRFSTRLKKLFSSWIEGLKNAGRLLIGLFQGGNKSAKMRKKAFSGISSVSEALAAVYAPGKRKELQKNISLFARLIVWGDEMYEVKWKPSYAPGEFCAALASKAPDKTDTSGKIIQCGNLFERAIYSDKSLDQKEENDFKNLVMAITDEREILPPNYAN